MTGTAHLQMTQTILAMCCHRWHRTTLLVPTLAAETCTGPKGQPSGYQIETADELPDIGDINEKNRKFWSDSTSQSVTGMGNVPIGGQGTPGRPDNGIDVNRRLGTGSERLDPGRTKQQQPESVWHDV